MVLPQFRFHQSTGDRRGTYAVTVKANWRVTFRFHEGAERKRTDYADEDPSHPGDLIRDCLDELGANVTDAAKALGVTRTALSRVINRRAGVSAEMALRLEKAIGSTAGFWLRLQLNYDLAQIRMRGGKIHARRLGTPAQLAL